jgi:hypothetical protein
MRQEGPLSTMQYYSAIRKNEGMSFARKWIELEIIIVEQNKPISERQISLVFSHMRYLIWEEKKKKS